MVQRVVVPYHPPSGEPVGICRPSVAWPQKVQPFVVPHFSQTPPNHRPENLRSRELPTGSTGAPTRRMWTTRWMRTMRTPTRTSYCTAAGRRLMREERRVLESFSDTAGKTGLLLRRAGALHPQPAPTRVPDARPTSPVPPSRVWRSGAHRVGQLWLRSGRKREFWLVLQVLRTCLL